MCVMKNFSLSPRLAAMLSCVEKCGVLADIGTDHAYLPIEACRAGICARAIACDVSAGPLEIAARNIRAAGLAGRIETRLGDGLAPLGAGEADCIVIAGMGGMKIIEILSAKKNAVDEEQCSTRRLVLQPQHDLEEVRRFLHANGCNILEEKLAREGSRFYVIIVAAAGAGDEIAPYTDAEYFLGRLDCADAADYCRDMRRKILAYFDGITDADARELAERRLAWIEGIIG